MSINVKKKLFDLNLKKFQDDLTMGIMKIVILGLE